MQTLNFPTRASYLAYRAEMRETYRQLSIEIRKLKEQIKQTFRAGGYAGNEQASLAFKRFTAAQMMEERQEAKKIAVATWEQWRAAEKVAA